MKTWPPWSPPREEAPEVARRVFTARDIVEIFEHWQAGRSIRAIARSLGLDRNTVRKYVRAAEDAGYSPGVRRSPQEWAEFVRQRFPRVADDRLRGSSFARIEPYLPGADLQGP